MKIEAGDFVIYQRGMVKKEEDIPTIEMRLIKVIEVYGNNGEYFKDKENEVYDHFRVRYLYKVGGKGGKEYDGYDGVRCIQEDEEKLSKGV